MGFLNVTVADMVLEHSDLMERLNVIQASIFTVVKKTMQTHYHFRNNGTRFGDLHMLESDLQDMRKSPNIMS